MTLSLLSLPLAVATLATPSPLTAPQVQVHVSGQSELIVERTDTHHTSYRRLPGTNEFVKEVVVPVERPRTLSPRDQRGSPDPEAIPPRHQQTLIGCW